MEPWVDPSMDPWWCCGGALLVHEYVCLGHGAVHRFREGDLTKELLVSCYLAVRTHYFMQLGQRLDEAGRDTWQVS